MDKTFSNIPNQPGSAQSLNVTPALKKTEDTSAAAPPKVSDVALGKLPTNLKSNKSVKQGKVKQKASGEKQISQATSSSVHQATEPVLKIHVKESIHSKIASGKALQDLLQEEEVVQAKGAHKIHLFTMIGLKYPAAFEQMLNLLQDPKEQFLFMEKIIAQTPSSEVANYKDVLIDFINTNSDEDEQISSLLKIIAAKSETLAYQVVSLVEKTGLVLLDAADALAGKQEAVLDIHGDREMLTAREQLAYYDNLLKIGNQSLFTRMVGNIKDANQRADYLLNKMGTLGVHGELLTAIEERRSFAESPPFPITKGVLKEVNALSLKDTSPQQLEAATRKVLDQLPPTEAGEKIFLELFDPSLKLSPLEEARRLIAVAYFIDKVMQQLNTQDPAKIADYLNDHKETIIAMLSTNKPDHARFLLSDCFIDRMVAHLPTFQSNFAKISEDIPTLKALTNSPAFKACSDSARQAINTIVMGFLEKRLSEYTKEELDKSLNAKKGDILKALQSGDESKLAQLFDTIAGKLPVPKPSGNQQFEEMIDMLTASIDPELVAQGPFGTGKIINSTKGYLTQVIETLSLIKNQPLLNAEDKKFLLGFILGKEPDGNVAIAPNKDGAKTILNNLKLASSIINLKGASLLGRENLLMRYKERSGTNSNAILVDIQQKSFGELLGGEISGAVVKNFYQQMVETRSRSPNLLGSYTGRLNNLPHEERTKYLEKTKTLINEFSNQTFINQRYAESPHLNQLKDKVPGITKRWQEATVNFSQGGYTIASSDDLTDWLAMGSEVLGSCLSIESGGLSDVKCLLGNVMDGKAKLIELKKEGDPNGPTIGRVVLKLLWDDVAKKPVILMEGCYSNLPDQSSEKALVEQALQAASEKIAEQLGFSMVAGVTSFGGGTNYPNPIASLAANRAPAEKCDPVSSSKTTAAAETPEERSGLYTLARTKEIYTPA